MENVAFFRMTGLFFKLFKIIFVYCKNLNSISSIDFALALGPNKDNNNILTDIRKTYF